MEHKTERERVLIDFTRRVAQSNTVYSSYAKMLLADLELAVNFEKQTNTD